MSWFLLIIAGLCETLGVAMINQLNKDRSAIAWLLLIGGFGASFLFLAAAMEDLPMGTAYAVWTGIGASGGAAVGMLFYNEPKSVKRILFITLVLAAAVGLKLVS